MSSNDNGNKNKVKGYMFDKNQIPEVSVNETLRKNWILAVFNGMVF
jgi:hypothetical protein